jgi:shikimate kinase
MGAGKTSVGRLLAEWLERRFLDTDDEAERLAGRSILDCFRAGDEALFRDCEAAAVRAAVNDVGMVIALGGGAMLREDTRRLLLDRTLVVHLHVPWHRVRERLPELVGARPLLQGRTEAEVEGLYRARLSVYSQAHLEIRVPPGGPEVAARRVIRALNNGGWETVPNLRRSSH